MPSVITPLPDVDEPVRGDTVLLADASVESDAIAATLRRRGFVVFEVPLPLLEARVASEEPRVVILDVEQPGALERTRHLRELPSGRRTEILCIGDPLRAAELFECSLSEDVFERPVDTQRLADRVAALAHSGGTHGSRGTTPPPLFAQRPSAPAPSDSVPPVSELPRGLGLEASAFLEDGGEPTVSLGLLAGPASLSPTLAEQLRKAEERVRATLDLSANAASPSEDADCAVPAELLAQLDEPLDPLEELEGTGGLAIPQSASGAGTGSIALAPPKGTSATGGGFDLANPESHATRGGLQVPAARESSRDAAGRKAETHVGGTSSGSLIGTEQPINSASAPSPARGIRLGELLGIRASSIDVPRAAPSSPEGPPPPRTAEYPILERMLNSAGALPLHESSDLDGHEFARPPESPAHSPAISGVASSLSLPHPATHPLLSAPFSPPVRFQEPREIGEGRRLLEHDGGLLSEPPPRTDEDFRNEGTPVHGRRATGPSTPQSLPQPIARPSTTTLTGASLAGFGGPSTPPATRGSARPEEQVSPAAKSVRPSAVQPLPSGGATARGETASVNIVFGPEEGLRPLARAIATRTSGCLALSTRDGVRRVVLADGDLVTSSSEIPEESLVAFLAHRGDLTKDIAARLGPKLPPSGRHAGAALIAQGHLLQDDLWPVLRAHAEWLLGNAMMSGPGSAELEEDPPGRLKAEPNVFGGATGAEVLIETARRALSPGPSLAVLGGPTARLDRGPRQALLSECALSEPEESAIRNAPGKTIAETCGDLGSELVSVLRALAELEVLSVLAPVAATAEQADDAHDPLDEEAVRLKVRAKMSLVREGDYFALLGVARTATAYEIRRAFLALRRAFEPARLLNARTQDLYDDVQLIVEVLEEAFDVLRDTHRRERYRRAIDSGPPA
ncbi:MAG: hypothetical protein U0271_04695 [Polyangiaceae bacterium]